jgi:hypothetical protein
VARAFPTEEAVNEALRLAIKITQIPVGVTVKEAKTQTDES